MSIKKAIVLYLHVHQPYRLRHYSIFDVGNDSHYFDSDYHALTSNERLIHKVSEKSYLPTNQKLLELLHNYPEFKLSLSITGPALEQMEMWAPATLESFKALVGTGKVEILAETYYHSLAFFYNREEFAAQVEKHQNKIRIIFGVTPKVFRGTELSYNNELAAWAEQAGYDAVLAEGWDPVLGWRSANFVYQPVGTNHIKLLMKNYKLSDDIAFRFGDRNWAEWPLTADKFVHWLNQTPEATNFNLFMDYETFGEHQWDESGIFDFLDNLPKQWLKQPGNTFMTVSEAATHFGPVDRVDVPNTITWADTERDLSAWLGNPMQQQAINELYALGDKIKNSSDESLIDDWRKLQISDHYYYMCTKWFNDGDIHAYFSPYATPYEAFMAFMNALNDIKYRLSQKGVMV